MSGIDPAIPDSTDPHRRQYERMAELFRRLAVLERRWGYEPSRFAGELVPSCTAVVPPGYVPANGQGITSTHPSLRQALVDAGSPHGTDGSGDPRVPNMNAGRFPRGNTVPGGVGGASSHSHGVNAHSHGVLVSGTTGVGTNSLIEINRQLGTGAFSVLVATHTHDFTGGGGTDAVGGSTDGQSNLPPHVDTYWLVKT